jgi:DHA1 family tetracycline resistance protein-like MFS transporter
MRLAVLFFTVFLDLLGFGMIVPLQPLLAQRLGASGLEVGLLMAAYSGMQLVFAPLWGRLSDRVGRRPVLLVSIAGSSVSMLVFAAAQSLPVLFAARLLGGLCAANIATAQAYVADVTTPDQRARGMGVIGAALGMGFVIGPAAGGALSHLGWSAPAFAAAAMSALDLVLAAFLLPESLRPEDRARARARRTSRFETLRGSWDRPLLPLLFGLFFLVTFGFSQMEATFSLLLAHRFGYGPAGTGYLFTMIGLILAATQGGLVAPLQRRLGEPAMLVAGTLLLTTGLLLLAGATALPPLLAACALLAFGQGIHAPALSSLVSRQALSDEQGAVLGANQGLGSLARVLGPAAGGLAFDVGDAAPFLSAAGALGCAVLLASVVLHRCRAPEGRRAG